MAREGLYLQLDAYKTYVFAEIKDLVDHTDGRWRRLADWLGGRGVPSLEVGLREMELAPFHAALRADDAASAVREAAALVGVPDAKAAPKLGAVDAVDLFLAGVRPRLAGGRWIDEWLADRALPNADLAAVRLRMAAARDGLSPDLLRDEHFRRLIGVNTHEGAEYFSKEGLDSTLKALELPAARRRELLVAAEKSGYRVDRLAEALRSPAKPAAAKLASAKPASAKPAAAKPAPAESGPAQARSPAKAPPKRTSSK